MKHSTPHSYRLHISIIKHRKENIELAFGTCTLLRSKRHYGTIRNLPAHRKITSVLEKNVRLESITKSLYLNKTILVFKLFAKRLLSLK